MSKMGYAMTRSASPFITRLLTASLPGSEIWQMFVGDTILSPFGLANRTAFIAPDMATVTRIKAENPELAKQGFYVPRQDRPKVFIMGGTVVAPLNFKGDASNAVFLQMSPDFTGSPFWANDGPLDYSPARLGALQSVSGLWVGGYLVETF